MRTNVCPVDDLLAPREVIGNEAPSSSTLKRTRKEYIQRNNTMIATLSLESKSNDNGYRNVRVFHLKIVKLNPDICAVMGRSFDS